MRVLSPNGVQNRNFGIHKPLISGAVIMEKDPKCAKNLILHTTDMTF